MAADWPNWRGPGYTGIQPDGPKLLDAWKKGPLQVWNSEPLPSGNLGGYSSPVVANGKVYLYISWKNYEGNSDKDVLVCLDQKTGATLWKAVYPGINRGQGNSSTPAIADGRAFVLGGSAFYCVDAETGKSLWSVPAWNGASSDGSSCSSSPVVAGKVVVVGAPLRGFDVETGKQLWECAAAGTNIHPSPILWKAADRMLVIANLDKFCAIDPKDGTVVWTAGGDHCNPTPTLSGDYLIMGNYLALYKLSPEGATKVFGTNMYEEGASDIIYQQHVYAYNGSVLHCLDFTGKELWQQYLAGSIASVVGAGGKGFVISGDGILNMFALTPEKPTFYKVSLPVSVLTTPTIVNGKMFVHLRGGKGVGCYDLTTEATPAPNEIDRSSWVATSIAGPAQSVLSEFDERWTTQRAMLAGDWLQIDMLKSYKLTQVVLDSTGFLGDTAQGVQLWLSTDGTTFTKAADLTVEQTKQMNGVITCDLPSIEARFIKFVNMGTNGPAWWSVVKVTTKIDMI
jgi:outer membrane protein assembly factor BamB